MKYFSLFSGIGGFEQGIKQAHESLHHAHRSQDGGIEEDTKGNERQGLFTTKGKGVSSEKRPVGERPANVTDERPLCVGYSEIDKYASQIYQSHFPQHKNYGDITKINESTLPDFELLVGGFPCQSFSIAGKRAGFEDVRGTLFFDICRIIKEKRPRLLLLENVKGLLSHDQGRTFSTILATLDELGYDLQWQVLNSKNFGVPQNRERVFIVGHLRGTPRPEVFPFGSGNEEVITNNPDWREQISSTITTQYGARNGRGTHIAQINKPKHSNERVYSDNGISPTLNTMQGGNRQPFVAKTVRSGGRASPHGSKQNWDSYEFEGKIRRLTPKECERLQGFPDDWTSLVSASQRYKCCGNAVTVNVIQAVMEKMLWKTTT